MTPQENGPINHRRRKALRFTQAELAARAGMGRRTLIELEKGAGTTAIGLREFARILNALGLALSIREAQHRPTEDELRKIFADEDDDGD